MPEWLAYGVFVVGVLLLTGISVFTDTRSRRIPNWLTVSAFFAGLVYQGAFHQWPGLFDAGRAFGVGFGTFFVLWIIGGGGGGDVKLMGALSVWLGFKLTVYALVLSMVFVVVGTVVLMAWTAVRRKSRESRVESQESETEQIPSSRQDRRLMAYALPLSLAVWMLMLLGLAPRSVQIRDQRTEIKGQRSKVENGQALSTRYSSPGVDTE